MSILLEESSPPTVTASARLLRTTMAAMRLSFTWFGTRKTLTQEQKSQAADTFGAEGDFPSAGKKLVDTKHPAFRAVTAVHNRAISLFKGVSLPYSEPGIRLVKQDEIEKINGQMTQLREELDEAVEGLNRHYGELKVAARQRLGSLYNEQDYCRRYPSDQAALLTGRRLFRRPCYLFYCDSADAPVSLRLVVMGRTPFFHYLYLKEKRV